MWVEILIGKLKNNWKKEDINEIIKWNTEYHKKKGIGSVRYFISEDKKNFVMIIEYKNKDEMERLKREWEEAKTEEQEWFQKMVSKVFESGQSKSYEEIKL